MSGVGGAGADVPRLWSVRGPLPGNGKVGGEFTEGTATVDAGVHRARLVIGGAKSWRVRFKSSQSGTLAAQYLRPGQEQGLKADTLVVYAANQPTPVVVSAATETKIEATAPDGSTELLLTFTNDSTPGEITYCDLCLTASRVP